MPPRTVIAKATCLLFSADAAWSDRLARSLPEHIVLRVFGERLPLESALERHSLQVLLADLRAPAALELLQQVRLRWPAAVLVAFGVPGSDPCLAA